MMNIWTVMPTVLSMTVTVRWYEKKTTNIDHYHNKLVVMSEPLIEKRYSEERKVAPPRHCTLGGGPESLPATLNSLSWCICYAESKGESWMLISLLISAFSIRVSGGSIFSNGVSWLGRDMKKDWWGWLHLSSAEWKCRGAMANSMDNGGLRICIDLGYCWLLETRRIFCLG